MRTIRTKQSNKKNKRTRKIKKSNFKFGVDRPIQTTCILAKIARDYLVIHRATWEEDDSYLKPYHKGTLTMTIKRLDSFLDKWKGIPILSNFEEVKDEILETLKPYVSQVSTLNLNATDTIIYRSLVIALFCINCIVDVVKHLYFLLPELQADVKNIINVFKSYERFWMSEVDDIIINFY